MYNSRLINPTQFNNLQIHCGHLDIQMQNIKLNPGAIRPSIESWINVFEIFTPPESKLYVFNTTKSSIEEIIKGIPILCNLFLFTNKKHPSINGIILVRA